MRSVRAFSLAFVFGLACNGGTDSALEVTVPSELVSKTRWFEVAAYRDTDCSLLAPMLMNGLPEGLTARAAFRKSDPGPVFGKLPDGQYAFAAVARDENCVVLARGCTNEPDVSGASKVTIDLEKVSGESGKCVAGTSCQAARCVPANDNSDPSVGIGCSLELVGAGPLLHIAEGGALMSAPAIAATSTGFVIAYRESDGSGGAARLILLPIDSAGGLYGADKRDLSFEQVPILQQCGRQEETDGIGLVMAGENGLLLIANSCGDVPGDTREVDPNVQLVPFTVEEDPADKTKLLATPLRNFLKPTAVPPKLGATRAASNGMMVYVEGGAAKVAQIGPAGAVLDPISTLGTAVTDAWIASNEQALAVLTLAGAAAEGESPSLDLQIVPAAAASTVGTATAKQFSGTWGSIAAIGGRIIMVSNGDAAGDSVTIRAFDLNRGEEADSIGFSVEGEEDVIAGDVTTFENRAFVGALKSGTPTKGGIIELHAFDGAATKLTKLGSVSLGNEPRISGVKNVGDGRVAVAASSNRVAVAWTTKKQLDDRDNDPAGGYAVFACTK